MTVTLLLHCPDKPGIIADITNFITENRGNVVYLAQFVDRVENVFFMRIEWEIDGFLIPKDKIFDVLKKELINETEFVKVYKLVFNREEYNKMLKDDGINLMEETND